MLTGGRMKQSWLPPQAKDLISNVSNALDQTMLDLMHAIALPIFNTTIDQFGSAPIPFLKNGPKNLSDLNRNNNFGMLDIVYYKSPNPHSQTQLSVAEHYDPGLLSLNVLSDQPGLQFKTREGEWVDIPVDDNLCLLWTGEMCTYITLNRFPPAHHRVIVPSTTPFHPRLSIWIEICTEMQDLSHSMPILEKFSPLSAIASSITSIFSSDPSPPSSSNRNNNMNNNKSNNKNNNKKAPMTKLVLNPGESVASALLRSSRQYGMPATKSITYYCPFCLSRVGRLEPHFKEAHSDIAIEKE
uniref:Isopenicillin N synthase-like Fe(2+) 2OG dioxygenase domain-containing protein n=1 Tax=Arcella intermedia TaxID=1963864 RepID=A0A6B2LBK7_9EUKA